MTLGVKMLNILTLKSILLQEMISLLLTYLLKWCVRDRDSLVSVYGSEAYCKHG